MDHDQLEKRLEKIEEQNSFIVSTISNLDKQLALLSQEVKNALHVMDGLAEKEWVDNKIKPIKDRVSTLEKVVYGFVAIILVAVVGAMIKLVIVGS